jgi:hypothetical protein
MGKMKAVLVVVALVLSCTSPAGSRKATKAHSTKVCISCEEQRSPLASGAYVYAVMDQIWPPALPVSRGITGAILFRPEIRIFLHTDGSRFELWIDTADIPGDNVGLRPIGTMGKCESRVNVRFLASYPSLADMV